MTISKEQEASYLAAYTSTQMWLEATGETVVPGSHAESLWDHMVHQLQGRCGELDREMFDRGVADAQAGKESRYSLPYDLQDVVSSPEMRLAREMARTNVAGGDPLTVMVENTEVPVANKLVLWAGGSGANYTSLCVLYAVGAYRAGLPVPEDVEPVAREEAFYGARITHLGVGPTPEDFQEIASRPTLTLRTEIVATDEQHQAAWDTVVAHETGSLSGDAIALAFFSLAEEQGWIRVERQGDQAIAVHRGDA